MIHAFADRICSVVATETVTRNAGVIKIRGNPADRCMTVVAGITAGDVSLILADRYRAVVAGRAGAHYLCVINHNRGLEKRRAVAILAYVCS